MLQRIGRHGVDRTGSFPRNERRFDFPNASQVILPNLLAPCALRASLWSDLDESVNIEYLRYEKVRIWKHGRIVHRWRFSGKF